MQRGNLTTPVRPEPPQTTHQPAKAGAPAINETPDPESELRLPSPTGAVRACLGGLVGETPASMNDPVSDILSDLGRANATGYLANSPV